jgi:hypothetical protein
MREDGEVWPKYSPDAQLDSTARHLWLTVVIIQFLRSIVDEHKYDCI